MCLCLTACSSSDDEENVEPQLQVSPVALSLDRGEGNAETLSVTCNTEWTATASADWLTVTPASGSGNASVVVMTNEENPEPEMRSATVTVTAGGLKKTVSVTQDAGANLSVTPTETTLSAEEGSTATFDIATDVEWRIGSGPDWLSLSTRYGNGNGDEGDFRPPHVGQGPDPPTVGLGEGPLVGRDHEILVNKGSLLSVKSNPA